MLMQQSLISLVDASKYLSLFFWRLKTQKRFGKITVYIYYVTHYKKKSTFSLRGGTFWIGYHFMDLTSLIFFLQYMSLKDI